jgi:hypothetical protein
MTDLASCGAVRKENIAPDDEQLLALHPWVREAIHQENRDRPLTLNWKPVDPDAYAQLGLSKLSRNATNARDQIITEALVAGPDRYISYSRRKEFYVQRQRYHRATYSYRAIVPAIDQLAAAGLLDHEKRPPGSRGYQSRFRASDVLLQELERVEVVYEPLETILLRDQDGYLVDYRDNRDTRRMRKRLRTLNEGLASQQIAIGDRVIREGDRLDNGGRAQAQLHRIFNRSSFDLGGRFYGGHWQNIPSIGGRDQITINGKATIEVDYAALHVRLLYQEAGKTMVGDPYEIEGWPRKQVKLALLIGINARTHRSAVRALADALANFPDIRNRFDAAAGLLDAVRRKHPDIARAFGSDAGARLMRQDADLAERVKFEMLIASGIVPLSVHDSFIVPASEAGRLEEAMERHISVENTSNFATTHPLESPKEKPKVVPQYGIEPDLGDVWEAGVSDLLGTLREWRVVTAVVDAGVRAKLARAA